MANIGGGVQDYKPIMRPSDLGSSMGIKLAKMELDMGKKMVATDQPVGLTSRLETILDERRRRREWLEYEWLDAYRRYNNLYDAVTLQRFEEGKSRIFLGITRMKCNTAYATLLDFLFNQGRPNWDLEPESIPDDYEMPEFFQAYGITLQDLRRQMRRRCDAMKREMEDQLDIADYPEHMGKAMLECVITGSGAIKGPLTVVDDSEDWDMGFDENLRMFPIDMQRKGFRPDISSVSVFNLFPDMEVSNPQKGQGVFEEMLLSRADLIKLAGQPGFKADAILACLREKPDGNAVLEPVIRELRTLSGDTDPDATNRYRVVCYYGPVSGYDLQASGIDIDPKFRGMEVNANIWWSGNYVIKTKIHRGRWPYLIFPYVERSGMGPFGVGVPILIKSSQDTINGSARMMLDNAAIASGPIIEANTDLLEPGEDPSVIHGWRIFKAAHDGQSGRSAIRVFNVKSWTPQYIAILETFQRMADEESLIPSITQGEQGIGTTKTATGMSILNTNANRNMKMIMSNVDGRCIEPLVEMLYRWNMRFNINTAVLGPMKCKAVGKAAVMAKEIETQRLLELTSIFSQHPSFKTEAAMREIVAGMDQNPDELVVTEEEKQGMIETAEDQGLQPTEIEGERVTVSNENA